MHAAQPREIDDEALADRAAGQVGPAAARGEREAVRAAIGEDALDVPLGFDQDDGAGEYPVNARVDRVSVSAA